VESTGNANMLFVDASANAVGIGTNTPTNRLHVESTDSSQGVIYAEYTGTDLVDVAAVEGVSIPGDYYGIGGFFEGGYIGVEGQVLPTGSNEYIGVVGLVGGGSGTNYGVFGSAFGGTTNWAGYFEGDVGTTGDYKYLSPKTSYLSIPAPAFDFMYTDEDDEWIFTDCGRAYITSWGDGESNLVAPVNLPHGATVTNFTVEYYDDDAIRNVQIEANLRNVSRAGCAGMAYIYETTSGDSTNIRAFYDPTINQAKIDNRRYSYIIKINWDPSVLSSDLCFLGCRIEYTMDTIAP
jgi:hypothetical protein